MYPVFIYTLNCPYTGQVRYAGQTVNPDRRLRSHINVSQKAEWHVSRWIKKLLSNNLRPVMEILDVVPDNEADFWEREYIQNFRERGFDLTNLTDGGDGPNAGQKRPPEVGAKVSATKSGVALSPEHCAALSLAHLGNKPSEETRKKMSASQKERRNREKKNLWQT